MSRFQTVLIFIYLVCFNEVQIAAFRIRKSIHKRANSYIENGVDLSNTTRPSRCRSSPGSRSLGFCDALRSFGSFLDSRETQISAGFLVADANDITSNAIAFAQHVAHAHAKPLDQVATQTGLVGNIAGFVSVITDGIKVGVRFCDRNLFSCLGVGSMVVFGLSLLGLATFLFPTLFHAAAAVDALVWSGALPMVTGLMESIFENLCSYVIQTRFGPVIDIIGVVNTLKEKALEMARSVESFGRYFLNATPEMFQHWQRQLSSFAKFVAALVADPSWFFEVFVAHVQTFIKRQVDYVGNLATRVLQTPEIALAWAQTTFSEAMMTISQAVSAGVRHIRNTFSIDQGVCVKTEWGDYGIVIKVFRSETGITIMPSQIQAMQEPCQMSADDVSEVLPWFLSTGYPCCLPVGKTIVITNQNKDIARQAEVQEKKGPWPSHGGGPSAQMLQCAQGKWLVQIPMWQNARVWIRARVSGLGSTGQSGWACPSGKDGDWCRPIL